MDMNYWHEFYDGLAKRGFSGFYGEECSKGGCHTKDEKHYILCTDGMVIYSNYWDWNANKPYKTFPNLIVKEWHYNEFKFEELDELLNG